MRDSRISQRLHVLASGRWLTVLTILAAAFAAWRFGVTPSVAAQQPRVLAAPQLDVPAVAPLAQPIARPALAQATDGNALSIVSDVAELSVQSVVNISTTKMVHVREQASPEEMMRRFWGMRTPGRGDQGDSQVERANSLGSGVIVSSDGVILTNNHVIDGATTIKVKLSDGREHTAKVVGTDPRSDVAVLRLEGKVEGLKALPLAESDKLRLGEVVLAIGSPFGLSQTVTMGIVSAKGRADLRIVDYEDFIQTDAAINPGNSGGALVNLRGELVGINTAIFSKSGGSQGIGFAIPANMARSVMDGLLKNGKISRGFLGVGIQEMTDELQQEFHVQGAGVLVSDVQAGGPADKAGLKRGDIVQKLGDQVMDSPRRLRAVVGMHAAGTKLQAQLLRDGKPQSVDVVLGEAPEAQAPRKLAAGALDGLTVAPIDDAARQKYEVPPQIGQGVVVTEVAEQTAAARAGMQPGDVVLEVNRRPVQSVGEFQKAMAAVKGRLLLLVYREGGAFYLALR